MSDLERRCLWCDRHIGFGNLCARCRCSWCDRLKHEGDHGQCQDRWEHMHATREASNKSAAIARARERGGSPLPTFDHREEYSGDERYYRTEFWER